MEPLIKVDTVVNNPLKNSTAFPIILPSPTKLLKNSIAFPITLPSPTKLLKGEKVPVYGDGMNIRDWLFVYDHCAAIDTVLHKGEVGEVYNIGGHNEKSNIEITKLILAAMGKNESSIEYVQDRLGHDKRYAIDNTKIQTQLGWQPSLTFEEGIKSTIDWYLSNQSWMHDIENKKANLV